jgi:hypothetical protein
MNLLLAYAVIYAFSGSLFALANFSSPRIVEDGSGKRIAIFLEQGASGAYFVKGSIWSTETGWSTPVTISSASRSAFGPVITVNRTTGNVIAAWEAFDPSEGIAFVEAVLYPVNNDWGVTSTISTASEDAAYGDAQVTIDSLGNLCAIWTSSNPTSGYTSIRSSNGAFGSSPSWSTPVTVAAGDGS